MQYYTTMQHFLRIFHFFFLLNSSIQWDTVLDLYASTTAFTGWFVSVLSHRWKSTPTIALVSGEVCFFYDGHLHAHPLACCMEIEFMSRHVLFSIPHFFPVFMHEWGHFPWILKALWSPLGLVTYIPLQFLRLAFLCLSRDWWAHSVHYRVHVRTCHGRIYIMCISLNTIK